MRRQAIPGMIKVADQAGVTGGIIGAGGAPYQ